MSSAEQIRQATSPANEPSAAVTGSAASKDALIPYALNPGVSDPGSAIRGVTAAPLTEVELTTSTDSFVPKCASPDGADVLAVSVYVPEGIKELAQAGIGEEIRTAGEEATPGGEIVAPTRQRAEIADTPGALTDALSVQPVLSGTLQAAVLQRDGIGGMDDIVQVVKETEVLILPEDFRWKTDIRDLIPKWGTTVPVTLEEADIEIFDTAGRPLSEYTNINPAGVPFDFIPGLADDGRDKYQVNISAFYEVAKNFPDTLGLISHLRHEFQPYGTQTTADGMESVLNALEVLPKWMVLRADNPICNGEVSSYITGASKIARGAMIPFRNDLAGDSTDAEKISGGFVPLTTQKFMDKVFGEGLLIRSVINDAGEVEFSETKQACPAPRIMFEQLATVLFDNSTDNRVAVGGRLGLSSDELQRVRQFGDAYNQAMLAVSHLIKLIKNQDLDVLLDESSMNGDKAGLLAEIYHYLTLLNSAQYSVNESLGREVPQPLTLPDILVGVAGDDKTVPHGQKQHQDANVQEAGQAARTDNNRGDGNGIIVRAALSETEGDPIRAHLINAWHTIELIEEFDEVVPVSLDMIGEMLQGHPLQQENGSEIFRREDLVKSAQDSASELSLRMIPLVLQPLIEAGNIGREHFVLSSLDLPLDTPEKHPDIWMALKTRNVSVLQAKGIAVDDKEDLDDIFRNATKAQGILLAVSRSQRATEKLQPIHHTQIKAIMGIGLDNWDLANMLDGPDEHPALRCHSYTHQGRPIHPIIVKEDGPSSPGRTAPGGFLQTKQQEIWVL